MRWRAMISTSPRFSGARRIERARPPATASVVRRPLGGPPTALRSMIGGGSRQERPGTHPGQGESRRDLAWDAGGVLHVSSAGGAGGGARGDDAASAGDAAVRRSGVALRGGGGGGAGAGRARPGARGVCPADARCRSRPGDEGRATRAPWTFSSRPSPGCRWRSPRRIVWPSRRTIRPLTRWPWPTWAGGGPRRGEPRPPSRRSSRWAPVPSACA